MLQLWRRPCQQFYINKTSKKKGYSLRKYNSSRQNIMRENNPQNNIYNSCNNCNDRHFKPKNNPNIQWEKTNSIIIVIYYIILKIFIYHQHVEDNAPRFMQNIQYPSGSSTIVTMQKKIQYILISELIMTTIAMNKTTKLNHLKNFHKKLAITMKKYY